MDIGLSLVEPIGSAQNGMLGKEREPEAQQWAFRWPGDGQENVSTNNFTSGGCGSSGRRKSGLLWRRGQQVRHAESYPDSHIESLPTEETCIDRPGARTKHRYAGRQDCQ